MDKRKHTRYYAKERAIVMVTPGLQDCGYHIIDISKGGLALRYLGEEEWAEKTDQIDVWFDDNISIPALPVNKVASDVFLNASYISMRRLGVQFGELTPEQEVLLDHFLTNYTEDEIRQLAMLE